MNQAIVQIIRNECEKIEKDSGHGTVTIKIRNGTVYHIEASRSILLTECPNEKIDKVPIM